MGRFSVEFEVANFEDMVAVKTGNLAADQVRREKISGVVDSGATRLVLPASVAKSLGIPIKGKTRVRYADGRKKIRTEVSPVFVRLQGREDVFSAVVEPKRQSALIGAIVLEDLDFVIDCTQQRLVPRDPDYVLSELE